MQRYTHNIEKIFCPDSRHDMYSARDTTNYCTIATTTVLKNRTAMINRT